MSRIVLTVGGVVGERHANPFVGDLIGGKLVVPGEAAQGIPVGLAEMVPAPVRVQARIEHADHAGEPLRLHRAFEDFADRRAGAVGERVGIEEFLPHGAQVDEVLGLAEIFLRRLNFGEDRSLLERAEQRVKRLAGLKIERAVFDLQQYVGAELTVELGEFDVGALGAVGIDIFIVNKRAPDDVAAVRRDGVGQHVDAFGMIAAVIFRPGLAFGIRFDQEAAEVGNERVNFIGFGFPPGDDIFIERIGRGQIAETFGSGKVGGQDTSECRRDGTLPPARRPCEDIRPKECGNRR